MPLPYVPLPILAVLNIAAAAISARYHQTLLFLTNNDFSIPASSGSACLPIWLLFPSPLLFIAACFVFSMSTSTIIETHHSGPFQTILAYALGFGWAGLAWCIYPARWPTVVMEYLPGCLTAGLVVACSVKERPGSDYVTSWRWERSHPVDEEKVVDEKVERVDEDVGRR